MPGFPVLCAMVAVTAASPAARAVAYLAREVPRWSVDNKCYSCHNNGDAARALYMAHRLKFAVPGKALADTSAWLTKPERWHHNGGDVPAKDEGLARIQFAAALLAGIDAGLLGERQPLRAAAALVAEKQHKTGAWQVDGGADVGSPATYGTCLATVQARRILDAADAQRYRAAIARADEWLQKTPVVRVLDAAAVLLWLDGREGQQAVARRRECLATLRKGQAQDGGWGPYITAAPEAFDTALVVLALARLPVDQQVPDLLRRGRAYLIASQNQDGSWPETTRPTGAVSYAQRLSTAGWATLALLASR